MANPDSVAQLYFDSFSNARVAYATTVSMATAGRATSPATTVLSAVARRHRNKRTPMRNAAP
jgi:hypothetical protein